MATLKELREKAKAYELKGYSKLNKAQLEELIRKHNQAAQEQQETPAETAPVISTDTQAASTPEPAETTPADIQNADKFSVGSGENKRTYHITTRRLASPYLDRLFGILIDVCNSDNEVIASYAPLWHEDFVFNAKYPIHTSTKSAIEKAFMKKLPLFLKKSNLSNDNGRIISDDNEDLRNAVDEWCNTWGHNIGNFPIHEYDRKHQHESVQEVNAEPETPAKFVIGRHYQSIGSDISTVTFVGKCSRDYGYFVDSINCYHRVKIKTDSSGEYASISHKGGMYPPEDIKATVELPEHEIISVANGTCVLLNAETVIHSYQELEAMLAPKSVPVSKQPAPAPETKTPRHAVKIDNNRQILIQFDDTDTPEPAPVPAKPKTRRTRKPRVKPDYTRQLLIDFGEDIANGKTYHRQAA